MKFTTSFLIDCSIDHQRVVLDLLQKDGAVYILSSNSPMGYQSTIYTMSTKMQNISMNSLEIGLLQRPDCFNEQIGEIHWTTETSDILCKCKYTNVRQVEKKTMTHANPLKSDSHQYCKHVISPCFISVVIN